jgi:hypothetical protein
MVELNDKQKLALYKKSQSSGYSIAVLEQIYLRGYNLWNESFTGNPEQFGFDRVNSFIAGGYATELDADLLEGGKGLWANIHAKRARIKAGSGEKMRKPGSKGAPTREQIKSAQNEEYELDESESALAKKAAASGVSLGTLKKVYSRGVAAWRTGHRPGTTPQQWGMARVNSYITKGKGTYHGADKDLREEKLPEVPKDKETGLPKKYTTGQKGTDKARAAHFAKGREKHWDDPSAYGKAPGDATAKTRESKHTKKYRQMYGDEYTGAEKVSKNKNNPSSRFDGTTSLTNVYKGDTPGQMKKSTLQTIKKVIAEATYKGKTVPLNKPMKGDVKKSKVYVDPDGDGKAQKVNFGSKTRSIKKHIKSNKDSYCARSGGQGNLTNTTSANYWSRKAWDC